MKKNDVLWLKPPERPSLNDDEVHVWRGSLEQTGKTVAYLKTLLAAEELARAQRFVFPKDRDHFIVCRALLRILLGRYLHLSPTTLEFSYNPYGKPALAVSSEQVNLKFNVSHSNGLALFAFTHQREIGIDVEAVREGVETAEIAAQFFSPREAGTLSALPAASRTKAFFCCWTRKEAYIKAQGKGLSIALNQFDVSIAPEEPAVLLSVEGDARQAAAWSLTGLAVGSGYQAALAVEGRNWRLHCWELASSDEFASWLVGDETNNG